MAAITQTPANLTLLRTQASGTNGRATEAESLSFNHLPVYLFFKSPSISNNERQFFAFIFHILIHLPSAL